MKSFSKLKEIIAIGIMIALFLFISILSWTSIAQLQGNAKVVNYVGIVRGATQKLVKEELMGHPDDALVERLGNIVEELITGKSSGSFGLVVLQDEDYLDHMRQVETHWSELKQLITSVRGGSGHKELYDSSQAYFDLVNKTVFSAEAFSEKQVHRSLNIILGVIIIFIIFIVFAIIYFIRSIAVRKRAETLDIIAYVDPLTQIDNRASCERIINRITSTTSDENIAIFMFDMNDLKIVNDLLGHKGGDRVIRDFAKILKTEARDYGFVGRYGGDEFLGIFEGAGEVKAETYLARITEQVNARNTIFTNQIEKIKFAAGYIIGNARETAINDLINEADKRMYAHKRLIKQQ
jgi:diguanylate cyclase (GGDEF)-like protein